VFLLALTLMLAAILAAGLIHREMKGIGFEDFAILGTVHRGFIMLFTSGEGVVAPPRGLVVVPVSMSSRTAGGSRLHSLRDGRLPRGCNTGR